MAAVKKFKHEAVLFKAALVAGIKYAESFDLECQRRRRATNRNRLPRLTVKVARLQFFCRCAAAPTEQSPCDTDWDWCQCATAGPLCAMLNAGSRSAREKIMRFMIAILIMTVALFAVALPAG